jgi:hypothetical protein
MTALTKKKKKPCVHIKRVKSDSYLTYGQSCVFAPFLLIIIIMNICQNLWPHLYRKLPKGFPQDLVYILNRVGRIFGPKKSRANGRHFQIGRRQNRQNFNVGLNKKQSKHNMSPETSFGGHNKKRSKHNKIWYHMAPKRWISIRNIIIYFGGHFWFKKRSLETYFLHRFLLLLSPQTKFGDLLFLHRFLLLLLWTYVKIFDLTYIGNCQRDFHKTWHIYLGAKKISLQTSFGDLIRNRASTIRYDIIWLPNDGYQFATS